MESASVVTGVGHAGLAALALLALLALVPIAGLSDRATERLITDVRPREIVPPLLAAAGDEYQVVVTPQVQRQVAIGQDVVRLVAPSSRPEDLFNAVEMSVSIRPTAPMPGTGGGRMGGGRFGGGVVPRTPPSTPARYEGLVTIEISTTPAGPAVWTDTVGVKGRASSTSKVFWCSPAASGSGTYYFRFSGTVTWFGPDGMPQTVTLRPRPPIRLTPN